MGFIMFSQIDEVDFCDHCYLSVGDKCFYHGEYTPRRGFNYSETNNLILNLKKDMSRKETPEWRYKEEAIEKCTKLPEPIINSDFGGLARENIVFGV